MIYLLFVLFTYYILFHSFIHSFIHSLDPRYVNSTYTREQKFIICLYTYTYIVYIQIFFIFLHLYSSVFYYLNQMSNLYLCPDGRWIFSNYILFSITFFIDFWNCPIDNNHRVLAKRFQYHVRRCMIVSEFVFSCAWIFQFELRFVKANPHIQRVRCVFNANHLTTPQDLFNHMSTCPDAISTSTVLIGLSDIGSARSLPNNDHCRSASTTNWQMFHDVNATEDWDGENYLFGCFFFLILIWTDDIREKQARNSTTKYRNMRYLVMIISYLQRRMDAFIDNSVRKYFLLLLILIFLLKIINCFS